MCIFKFLKIVENLEIYDPKYLNSHLSLYALKTRGPYPISMLF